MRFCLVVPRTAIGECQRSDFEYVEESWLWRLLNEESFFAERDFMEKTSRYVQIIPYTVVCTPISKADLTPDKVLAYRRASDHTEQRLANNWSLGFGGHIDPEDLKPGMSKYQLITEGRGRELKEELGVTSFVPFGDSYLLNDLSDEVGSVHLGVVEQIFISSPELDPSKFGSEIAELKWVNQAEKTWSLEELQQLEGWSRILVKNLYKVAEEE